MWQTCIIALAIGGQIATPPAVKGPPAAEPQQIAPAAAMGPRVKRLVAELDAPERARRESAERELLDLGTSVLGLLPAVDAQASAELRQRIARIRAAAERAVAAQAGQPSVVTLHGSALTLPTIIQAIEQQTGNRLVDFRPQFGQEVRDLSLRLDLDKQPFWPAFDQLADAAGLTIYPYNDEPGLALVARPASQLPRVGRAVYGGAFRLEATGLTAHRDRRDPTQHTLQVDLEAAWEPRLRPIVVQLPFERIAALDNLGQPLALAAEREQLELNVAPGAKALEIPLHFVLPARSAQSLRSLRGQLQALLPGSVGEFRFDKLVGTTARSQRQAAVSVTLDQVRRNQQLWEVRMRVTFDEPAHALESHRNWVFNNEAWLETATGERVPYAGQETTSQTEREVGVAYLFSMPDGLAEHTFVYRTPASVLSVTVPFEMTNLELP